jgi:esterase/lipase/1-acyl-sn-glycerol-3-phosphate acyltransferase
MNRFAYRTTRLAIKTLSNFIKARVTLHGTQNIPQGSKIFVVNHFTRLETMLVPYYLESLLKTPIWSLASAEFYGGKLGRLLEALGALSNKHPDRDRLIVKSLMTNDASWVIFPEGRMVKNKKIIEKGRYIVSYAGGKHPPHTGAAQLALRSEFYRQRFLWLMEQSSAEFDRLGPMFDLDHPSRLSSMGTYIVPMNLTYYPLRARMNVLNKLAQWLVEDLPETFTEELMTEGSMLTSGVDIDIRFGEPIDIEPYLRRRAISRDIRSPEAFGLDDSLPCVPEMRRMALKIMQRYMRAIYDMTTINHDHIFASLLKHNPTGRVHMDNLRRRAFLAVCNGRIKGFEHVHTSLMENQNHLLMDDRFGKLADFLAVATETGVVQQEPPHLRLDRSKLRTILDFNRARVDNPVAVIANEVEPLKTLQRMVSGLCRQPGFYLRSRLVKYFQAKAEKDFDEDYERFHIPDESKPRHIGMPVLIRRRSRKVGIVLCHGYMAAPAEVCTLAEYLGSLGYCVYTPRLKGHGTSPEDLAQRSYRDWIESVEEGYLLMRNLCRHVVVGGFSTGAALALELACRREDLSGVFAVSTPLRLQDAASRLAPVVDTWNRLMDRVRWEDAKKVFVENKPENPEINYFRNPIAGVRELERLMDFLEPRLRDITIPALVVQSKEDPVVHPKGSERIFNLLGSVDKQYIAFNFTRHGILRGQGSQRVHRVIGEFIAQLPHKQPAPIPDPIIEAGMEV